MALNFPDSPALGQVYNDSTSGFSYEWDGVVWRSYSPSASSQIKILDDISGSFDGVTNNFPITISGSPFTPANAQQLRIVLGGIVQDPIDDYVVSGAQIGFTTPPSFGLSFSGVSLGPALPAVGVGSTATFYTRQSYNVVSTQSSFTVTAGYDIGYLDVYHNGVRLLLGVDYTASDGSGFTLATAAENGDVVEAISYTTTEYYTLNGVLSDLIVSGTASIGGNTYISGITTVVGSLNVLGGGNFSTSGIITAGGLVANNAGAGSTELIVEGDARVTGILTIGTSSITLDGSNNEIKIGSGVTITSTGINITGSSLISGVGIQSAGVAVGYGITTLNFVGTGNTFTVNGNSVDISISGGGGSYWVQTLAGIHTLSNVGIGTTNPSTSLSVGGTITELSQGQYWNVVTQADVGIGASQVPLNQYLGQLAFLDEYSPNVLLSSRIQSVGEKTTRISGNTANLSYNTGGGNIAICTNPTGNITLAVTDIPTTSDFDDTSLTFSVCVNQTGTARSCTAVTLNGFNATIRWAGGSLENAISGVTTTSGMDIYSFTGINTVGSASTTENYYVLGVVNGGYR